MPLECIRLGKEVGNVKMRDVGQGICMSKIMLHNKMSVHLYIFSTLVEDVVIGNLDGALFVTT